MAKNAINKMVDVGKSTLPIIRNTKINCTEHTMIFSTTNLETLINVSIPCTWDEYQTDITCLVKTSLLKTILKTILNKNDHQVLTLSFLQDENDAPHQLSIDNGDKTYKLACDTNVDEFINTTCTGGIREIHTTWDVLKTAISHISHAATHDDDRPVFTAIFFQLPHLVAADTFRLSIYDTNIIDDRSILEKFPWILVPENALSRIIKENLTGNVRMSVIPNDKEQTIPEYPFGYILFEWMEGEMSCQIRVILIPGTYPNWQTIVPRDASISGQFPQICEEIGILAKVSDEELHIMLLQTHNMQLTCSVSCGGVHEGLAIVVPCILPDGILANYNARYIEDVLKLMENPWIYYKDHISPVMFIDGPLKEVIMPLYSRGK